MELSRGEKSFVGVGWPQFDHNRNETSWHQMKQNEKTDSEISDIAYSMCCFSQCVRGWSTMGFKRPWVRFSPLGPFKSNDFTLEIVGFFSFTGWPHLALTTILTTMRVRLSGLEQSDFYAKAVSLDGRHTISRTVAIVHSFRLAIKTIFYKWPK